MRVTYITRSFLDYRVPVFRAMQERLRGGLHVIFNSDIVPARVRVAVSDALGEGAIGMQGELRLGPKTISGFANTETRFVYQPGVFERIAQTAPDVLIGDGFFQWTSFALVHRLRYGTPLVLTYERTAHTERNVPGWRQHYRRQVLRWVGAMAVNGSLSREYAESLGMPPGRIVTGQMVADTVGMATRASQVSSAERLALRLRLGGPELVFLAVGRLIERKGVGDLLLGWSRYQHEFPGSSVLALAGDGPLENDLQRQVSSMTLTSVVFLGDVDHENISRYYAASDILVMPTLEDNWSLVVPEAMACGLPVLCSKYNGCYPELIDQGRNGWIFDPLDPEDTYLSLKRCFQDRHRLKSMGDHSRVIVSAYSPENAAEAILEACQIAVNERSRRNAYPVGA